MEGAAAPEDDEAAAEEGVGWGGERVLRDEGRERLRVCRCADD